MSTVKTMRWNVRFTPVTKGKKTLGLLKEEPPSTEQGRVPRVARLMALAIKFEGMIRDGVVRDYAELGRLGKVTRARISQIMGLLNLAPDIQEHILFLPRVQSGREPLKMRHLVKIAARPPWNEQREAWKSL